METHSSFVHSLVEVSSGYPHPQKGTIPSEGRDKKKLLKQETQNQWKRRAVGVAQACLAALANSDCTDLSLLFWGQGYKQKLVLQFLMLYSGDLIRQAWCQLARSTEWTWHSQPDTLLVGSNPKQAFPLLLFPQSHGLHFQLKQSGTQISIQTKMVSWETNGKNSIFKTFALQPREQSQAFHKEASPVSKE